MSKVAIQGNASGTGVFTIASPNGNTDRTLTLPDEAGTVLSSGTPLSSFPSGFANGITHSCIFRLTAAKTSSGVLSANLEESDDASYSGIGSPVTESSGVFTFPATGIWQVTSYGLFRTTSLDTVQLTTEVSTDGGSTWDAVTDTGGSTSGGNNTGACTALIDCTSTANVKVRFSAGSVGSGSDVYGDTNLNRTHFIFTRLGDT